MKLTEKQRYEINRRFAGAIYGREFDVASIIEEALDEGAIGGSIPVLTADPADPKSGDMWFLSYDPDFTGPPPPPPLAANEFLYVAVPPNHPVGTGFPIFVYGEGTTYQQLVDYMNAQAQFSPVPWMFVDVGSENVALPLASGWDAGTGSVRGPGVPPGDFSTRVGDGHDQPYTINLLAGDITPYAVDQFTNTHDGGGGNYLFAVSPYGGYYPAGATTPTLIFKVKVNNTIFSVQLS
jgi:hypothetical protein